MKRLKKVLCLLLCFVMVLGLLPVTTLATEDQRKEIQEINIRMLNLDSVLVEGVRTSTVPAHSFDEPYSPGHFSLKNHWYRKTKNGWTNATLNESAFKPGEYRMQFSLSVSQRASTDYKLAEDVVVKIDGEPCQFFVYGSGIVTEGYVSYKDSGVSSLNAISPTYTVGAAGCTVTFDPNGGQVSPTSGITNAAGRLTSLPTPTTTDTSKKFDGWYDEKTGGNQVDLNKAYYTDTTIYAHWKVDPVFTKQPVGGKVFNGEKLTVNWELNFTPVKQALRKTVVHPVDGPVNIYSKLDPSATSCQVSPSSNTTYTILAYYDSNQYIASNSFTVTAWNTGTPVLFTSDSQARVGYSLTVDIEAMAETDDELMEAYLNDAVTYQWYQDGIAIGDINSSRSFTDSDAGKTTQVEVIYGNSRSVSETFTIAGHLCADDDHDHKCDTCGKTLSKCVDADKDSKCDICGKKFETAVRSVPMHRMYDPNSGEHFYTGSEVERDFLLSAGWHYEGVGFNFPEEGPPVYRLYDPVCGEHLYTMDTAEIQKLTDKGWNNEGVAFNSAGTDEVPKYRLHNPNAKRGGYHFTGSEVERQILLDAGWIDQGIGWYSCLK